MKQMTKILVKNSMVSIDTMFIDETKIEANANKYSFTKKHLKKSKNKADRKDTVGDR